MALVDIVYLCKVFKQESHARNFCAGNIRVTKLREFTRIDDGVDPRADRHEGISLLIRGPRDGKLCIKPLDADAVEIPFKIPESEELTARPDEDRYILCMYAAVLERGLQLSPQELQARLRPHHRCSELGDWVVLLDGRKFMKRLRQAALDAQCEVVDHRRVEYYDPRCTQKFGADAPFRKKHSYSWQSEYRVAFAGGGDDKSVKELKIGDISDITRVFTLADFTSASYSLTWNLT